MRGNWLVPPSIFGRFTIFCAITRQIHLILSIWLTRELIDLSPAAFFVDQLSAGLPLLHTVASHCSVRPSRPVIFFYCHFPDLLLVRGRESFTKRLYRLPFDTLEEWSMEYADAVAVNSTFTKSIVADTWPRLAQKMPLHVVYPCIDTTAITRETGSTDNGNDSPLNDQVSIWKSHVIFLSINRFERKKDIGLAIRAFAELLLSDINYQIRPRHSSRLRLVIAGGYDLRVAENVEYHCELQNLAASLGLSHATAKTLPTALAVPDDIQVVFLPSVPSRVKDILLASACLLLYTPQNEHFGIVPLEAMLWRLPVLAVDSGGPRETVTAEVGWRKPAREKEWSNVMRSVLDMRERSNGKGGATLAAMGQRGRERVCKLFGREKMGERLTEVFMQLEMQVPKKNDGGRTFSFVIGTVAVLLAILISLTLKPF